MDSVGLLSMLQFLAILSVISRIGVSKFEETQLWWLEVCFQMLFS